MNEVAWCYVEGYGCKKDKVCNFNVSHEPKLPNSFMPSLPLSYPASQLGLWLAHESPPLMTAFGQQWGFQLTCTPRVVR
jgi:hypothetical protein